MLKILLTIKLNLNVAMFDALVVGSYESSWEVKSIDRPFSRFSENKANIVCFSLLFYLKKNVLTLSIYFLINIRLAELMDVKAAR